MAAADPAEASPNEDGRGSPGPGGEAPRRRGRQAEVQEVVDELAQETKRVQLLDRVEQQLRGQSHSSRLFFSFGIADDRKVQSQVEQEWAEWREKNDKLSSAAISGLLLFIGQFAVHFLEGPTELLFSALEFFSSLASEVRPAGAAAGPGTGDKAPAPPQRSSISTPKAPTDTGARAPLVSSVRILHFTELHGIRASASWCALVHGSKAQAGGSQVVIEEANAPELAFGTYKRILLLCHKVKEASGSDADPAEIQANYKKLSEQMPTADEVSVIVSKGAADFFFSYAEFEKVFIAPFQLVLHSELLWPMPPALSY